MAEGHQTGIVIGLVTDLDDPLKLGRVKVHFHHSDTDQTDWARIVTPMAGADRGLYLIPEVGDEVIIAFAFGDQDYPYILGGVWSQKDKPPTTDAQTTKNNWRFIKSRSGHIVKLDDTQGAEKIEIVDKTGQNSIVFDATQNTIKVKATTKVMVEAQTVEVSGQTEVNIHAPQVSVKGDTSLSIQAPTVDLKATGQMTINGGGMLTLQGGLIKIN